MSIHINFGPFENSSNAYRKGNLPLDMLEVLDLSNLMDTPELLRMYQTGEISRADALRLHTRLVGTHSDPLGVKGGAAPLEREPEPEHQQLGLLGMNGGDQQETFRQLTNARLFTDNKLENLNLLVTHTTLTSLNLDSNGITANIQSRELRRALGCCAEGFVGLRRRRRPRCAGAGAAAGRRHRGGR